MGFVEEILKNWSGAILSAQMLNTLY